MTVYNPLVQNFPSILPYIGSLMTAGGALLGFGIVEMLA
jgi:hypothetical protein